MAFTFEKDYLNLAEFLLEENIHRKVKEEACLRTAVSRAYYAAFHHCLKYAIAKHGYEPSRGGEDHVNVRKTLEKKDKKNAARKLRTLGNWRGECDYKENDPQLTTFARAAIEKAREVIKELN